MERSKENYLSCSGKLFGEKELNSDKIDNLALSLSKVQKVTDALKQV